MWEVCCRELDCNSANHHQLLVNPLQVTKTRNQLKQGTTTNKTSQNYPKPATNTNKTSQNDPKPSTIYPNTTGLCDICVDGRRWCCVTITLTIMHGIFSALSCSSHWNSHKKSKRALSLKTDQQIYFCNSNWCQVNAKNKLCEISPLENVLKIPLHAWLSSW